MTVSELIEFLKTQPQDLQVVHGMYSEYLLLNPDNIRIETLSEPRNDGWVASSRSNNPHQEYLVFPGN